MVNANNLRPRGRFILNGKVALAGNVQFWRIDDLDAGREGMQFLQRPAVLVLAEGDAGRRNAEQIVCWLNGDAWLEREAAADPDALKH